MLNACRERCGEMRLLAVTVLTSLDQDSLKSIGVNRPVADQVAALARLACEAGIHGVVCAPTKFPLLSQFPRDMLRVTPGIRPAGSAAGDQKRIMAPA